jgi:hypothetical protein
MDRRDILKLLAAAPLAASVGLPFSVAFAQSNSAGVAKPISGPGINSEVQGLYHLPKDHQLHGGPTYFTNDFMEWHYFTFLGKDKTTGHDVGMFWLLAYNGWVKDLNRTAVITLFAYHDVTTGEFYPVTLFHTGKFQTAGSGDPNYDFQYSVKDTDGKEMFDSYVHAQEKWIFRSSATDRSKIVNKVGKPYSMDVTGFVKAPGYIPTAYWGFESIGFNPLYNQNPETMYGLTYYYVAPQMEMKGRVTIAGAVHEIEGTAWFEHQWGNFKNTEQVRYTWGYARFDNGDTMTWRQYYGNPVGKLYAEDPFDIVAARKGWDDPHSEFNRFAFMPKGANPQFSFGAAALQFTPIKWWTSDESGVQYPWWSELKTPKGTFYYSPTHPSQESITMLGPFVEGALLLRKDSIDGPIVARGYVEMFQGPAWGPRALRGLPEKMEELQLGGSAKQK